MTSPAFLLLLPLYYYVSLCCTVLFAQHENDVNVATHKKYNQSSPYPSERSSSMGANGNTSGYLDGNCIHTLVNFENNPWWQVDLGRTYPVQRIDVWSRYNFKHRLYPFTITVDNQTCATITNYPTDSRKKEVTCSTVMYGQIVRITRQGNDEPLNMCEMQIWVPSEVIQCEVGKYGSGCSRDCSSHCGKGEGKNFCYKSTGHCYDGCIDGWYGDLCSTPCSPRCQKTTCDTRSGQCACKLGYEGTTCTDCPGGRYGQDCAEKCGQCRGGQTCDHVTGHCSTGCQPGWIGPLPFSDITLCKSECEAGRYGDNCTRRCGHCFDTHLYGHCHPATGVCPYKCQTGWKMPLCQQQVSTEDNDNEDDDDDDDDKETVNTYVVVGSVIGGAIIIGVCIVILGLLLRRRSGKTPQNENTSNDTDLNTSPITTRKRPRGEREKTTTDIPPAQEPEDSYEIVEDTAVATRSSVHPGASISSDSQQCQPKAHRANAYDKLTARYSNTDDLHFYSYS